MRSPALVAAVLIAGSALAQTDYGTWPVLVNPFPSTGGGGFMIDGYDPVVRDGACTTDFQAIAPDGTRFRNTVVFRAVPIQGGILCTDARWRSLENNDSGTTPFEVFIRDGVARMRP